MTKHTPALYALVRLHAETAGRIKANKKEAEALRDDMRHIEHVLRLLEPGFDTRRIAVKRRNNPNPLFKRGHIFRAVLDLLREAPEPMGAWEIALALLKAQGVTEPTRDQVRTLYGGVNSSLRGNLGKTVAATEGRPRRWRITA